MKLSRFHHIQYYIASDQGKSNIYGHTPHIRSILDDRHTIEYRLWDFRVFIIFDIRWWAGHVISNMTSSIFDITWVAYD